MVEKGLGYREFDEDLIEDKVWWLLISIFNLWSFFWLE